MSGLNLQIIFLCRAKLYESKSSLCCSTTHTVQPDRYLLARVMRVRETVLVLHPPAHYNGLRKGFIKSPV